MKYILKLRFRKHDRTSFSKMMSQAKRGKDGKKDFSAVQEFYIATFSSPVSSPFLLRIVMI